ncbi:dipeptide epimerase [Porphyromonadaceae bacterium OttesenSCG-928-L07]|nr:dipeptide epimerase [Porphyromonadaceae bacterium OttesenSCG-928-L07]MDL2252315.1 dipeptide epimerase [Odoribacter sp. OttesenSCG-928-J03]MDL2331158.1 dipeptide epimerase [Odoribacter sp. OttesenSCG-928-A06]
MKLSFRPYSLQLKHTFTVFGNSRTSTPIVLVEIEYEGIIGYGEASLPPYLEETQETVMVFLSRVNLTPFSDPFQLEDILAYIDRIAPGNTAAKASVDIALHDLFGKLFNLPWYKIWGLNKSNAPSTTYTIGIDSADVMKKKTREVAGQFNLLKVKVGTDRDKEIIQAIRSESILPIAVDANQGWLDKQYALDMIYWMQEQGVIMIEQPMSKNRPDDIAWITERSPLPIFADESVQRLSDIVRLKGVFSGINIKLMKCTGMREAWKMINLAKTLDMKVMIGCMTETSCAVSAAAQLSPAVDFADLDGNLLISNDLFEGMQIVEGKITLSDLPGIGVKRVQG